MGNQIRRRRSGAGNGLGILLVALGALLLLGLLFGLGFWSLTWPFFVIVPGLFLFYLVKRLGKSGSILTIPATVVTTIGLLLLVSNTFGLWESWAYAWALIFPGSFGMGLAVYGDLARKPTAERWGENLAKVGLGVFLVGLVLNALFTIGGFFAGLLGVLVLPLLLMAAGVYLLRRGRKPKRQYLGARHYDSLDDGSSRIDSTLFRDERERIR